MNGCNPLFFCCAEASEDSNLVESSGVKNVRLFTYKELRNATRSFCQETNIGEGGFGTVYKGQLKNGKMAAIKVLKEKSKQGVKEFLTEIQVISEVRHENLVELYGCCVEHNKRIIVYNYLKNNSLQRALLGGLSKVHFPWGRRCKIAVGVARGLAFLHEEVHPYIVHRDIKASNILLDDDFNPKISDFGMAKIIPFDKTHVTTKVSGTIGYLAPEYAVQAQLTRQADIYSFGVLLLEIVSGRCNTNTRLPPGERYLLERAWLLHESNVLVTMVDESMEGMFDTEAAVRFLHVALLCVQEAPKLRPKMSTVVKMLTGKKKVDGEKIMKPGMFFEFLELQGKDYPAAKSAGTTKGSSSSSTSYRLDNSTFSWGKA